MGIMLLFKKCGVLTLLGFIITTNLFGQFTTEKGIEALQQGDSLKAYQYFESVYVLNPKDELNNYYYLTISLAFEKPFAEKLTLNWLKLAQNLIYKSRLNFQLGSYYIRHQRDQEALSYFNKITIDDLDNHEIIYLKFFQGYVYFKLGEWEKASPLLNSIRPIQHAAFYIDANYYAGFIALERKAFKMALSYFELVAKDPKYNRLAPFYIAQLHYFLGDVDGAFANCEKALKQGNQFYEIQLKQLMGHLLFEKKEYSKALPYLDQYVASQKKVDEQDLYQLSFCYYQSEFWAKAIDGFKQLATIEDSLGQNSMYLLANSYLKIKDKMGAKNAFLLCASKSQNIAQKEISLFNYAKLCIELKEFSAAVNSLDKFIINYPNSDYLKEAKDLWITALTFSNNYIQAYDAYQLLENPGQELIKIYPNIVFGRASLFLNDGQNEKAYALFDQLLSLPYNVKLLALTHFWLGELSYKMGRINESIQYLDLYVNNAVELGEVTIKHAKYTLGYNYLKRGNYQKALEYFTAASLVNKLIATENYQRDAFLRMADCQLMLKQLKQALLAYQQVINLAWKEEDYASLQKAIIYGGMGKQKEKIKLLLEFENNYTQSKYLNDARLELADTYVSQEDFQEAIAPLNKVLLDKTAISFFPQAYYKLGLVYFNLNKNIIALQTYNDLFKQFPNTIETDNAIEFVRNIYVEDQTPELFVQFMNDHGKSLSINEQDSLIYRAAIIKYEQKSYTEAANGLIKYLANFPNGKTQLDANYLLAEIAYSQDQVDTAVKYFSIVADQIPNKYAERASLIAARLNYFNLKRYDKAAQYFNLLLINAQQLENRNEAVKGLLRCHFINKKWEEAAIIAKSILADKTAATDDEQMANMALFHVAIMSKDSSHAMEYLHSILKSNESSIVAEAHYILAELYFTQNNYSIAEKTAFELIKKHPSYEFWVIKSYILLGDIYLAQNDHFNAIATYKSVVENSNIEDLKIIAQEKLNLISENAKKIK